MTARHDAVGHSRHETDNVDAQHVAGFGARRETAMVLGWARSGWMTQFSIGAPFLFSCSGIQL